MTKFTQYTGTILPLNIANVDTDSIIPKQFLKETTRSNFGQYLFFYWRFLENSTNTPNLNFILNQICYKNASILLTRRNFGCGSSREHAVWALIDYGFRAIIAPSFADIFYKNSFNNNLLLVTLSESEIDSLFKDIDQTTQKLTCTINLCNNILFIKNKKYSFQIDDSFRNRLINNIDRISLTLQYKDIIEAYENKQPPYLK